MKKEAKNQTSENHILKFDQITIAKNGSYVVRIGQNVLFLHPNLLAVIKQNSKRKAS